MNKTTKATVLTIGFAAIASVCDASDPLKFFDGPYAGVNVGGAWGSSNYHTNPNCPTGTNSVFCETDTTPSLTNGTAVANSGTGTLSSDGFTGGIQGGYNWYRDNIVFGGEADFSAFDLDSSTTTNGTFPYTFLGNSYTLTESITTQWLATLRGRVGMTIKPQILLYATGGAAFTDYKISSSYSDNAMSDAFPGGTGYSSKTNVVTGWTVGGGGEWFITHTCSLKVEYLYMNFGSVDTSVPLSNTPAYTQTMGFNSDLIANLVRFGINYRF